MSSSESAAVSIDCGLVASQLEAIRQFGVSHKASFVGAFSCMAIKKEHPDVLAYIFFSDVVQPEYPSRYFGLVYDRTKDVHVIVSGEGFENHQFCGILDPETGMFVYSRTRHDYRTTSDGHFIDGGNEYVRTNSQQLVPLVVVGDHIEVVKRP